MEALRGLVIPLPTVFQRDGSLDLPVIESMANFHVEAGARGIFIGGSMGQGPALSQDERKQLFRSVIGAVGRRVPTIAHIGTADPYTTIELGKVAVELGATAIALVGPYYYSDRSNEDLRAHIKLVCSEVNAPTLLYNNPKYQGYQLSASMMAQFVSDSPQIFGCKLARGGIDEASGYREAMGPEFKLFAMASSLFPGLLVGISGAISPPLTLCPQLGAACISAIDRRDYDEALRLQLAIIELQSTLMSPELRKVGGRGVYLSGWREQGFNVQMYPRWPTQDIPETSRAIISAAIAKAKAAIPPSGAASDGR